MKLNIGSANPKGQYKKDDWINIDIGDVKFSGNVQKIDARNMPDDWTGKFDEIHAIHVLEHNNRNDRFLFVSECFRVLASDGILFLEVPDFEETIRTLYKAMHNGDSKLEHNMTTSIYGKQRYTGDQHCWGYTQRTLRELLQTQMFEKVNVYKSIQNSEKMISNHYLQEAVLLGVAKKGD